jgi:hypothetical protein
MGSDAAAPGPIFLDCDSHGKTADRKQGEKAATGRLFRGRVVCSKMRQRYSMGASVTKPAERPRGADNDRREIAKRIFDALCAQYPQKYIALVQPRDPTPAVPNEN